MKEETVNMIEQKLRAMLSEKKEWEKRFFKLNELSRDVFKQLNKCYERIGVVEGKMDFLSSKVDSFDKKFKLLDRIDHDTDKKMMEYKNQVLLELEKETGEVKKVSAELVGLKETVDDWAINLGNTYNRVQTETHSLFVFAILNRLLNLNENNHRAIELEFKDLKAFIVKMVKEKFWNPSLEYNVLNSVKAIKARGGYFEKIFSGFEELVKQLKTSI